MAETAVENLVIIGSGPAAWTCAIYAARAALKPVVFEGAISEENRQRGTLPLGQLNLTTEVENFPGFVDSVIGPELMEAMRSQAVRFGTRVVTDDIVSADLSKRPFVLKDSAGLDMQCRALVVATGASANYLGLESEEKFKNRGVSACAVCDGALPRFRNRPLVVVGGGDSAVEEAMYLTKFASVVHLVHRRDQFRASRVMVDRAMKNEKLKPVWKTVVTEVLGKDDCGMTAVKLKNVETGEERTMEAAGLFVAIGHTPNTKFLNGQVKVDAAGFVVLTQLPTSATSVPGVFAAGDVADPVYKQAVTAAGCGCKAALDAEKWLAEQGVH